MAMCSGCAGDYAGGFDDSAEAGADSDHPGWPAWNWREPGEQGTTRNSEKTRAFEAESPVGGDRRSSIAPRTKDEKASEVWEILVSGKRIIEIRMIEGNDRELIELAAAAAGGAPPGQHSSAASAKYYQTRRAGTESTRNYTGMPCYRGISGFVGVELSKWVRWARKAFATSRARDSR
jgi:hypothetical protein